MSGRRMRGHAIRSVSRHALDKTAVLFRSKAKQAQGTGVENIEVVRHESDLLAVCTLPNFVRKPFHQIVFCNTHR